MSMFKCVFILNDVFKSFTFKKESKKRYRGYKCGGLQIKPALDFKTAEKLPMSQIYCLTLYICENDLTCHYVIYTLVNFIKCSSWLYSDMFVIAR